MSVATVCFSYLPICCEAFLSRLFAANVSFVPTPLERWNLNDGPVLLSKCSKRSLPALFITLCKAA